MMLEALFRSAVGELRNRNTLFAVAGGLAADLYRDQPRLTVDVDLAILTETRATETAVAVIETLGLHASIVREADIAGGPISAIRRRSTEPYLVIGRPPGEPAAPGVDILLPAVPWTPDAVRRAQANDVDFGFGTVPTLTLEDVIVAKFFALHASPVRAKDLDDLQSIFAAGHEVDLPYLAGQMRRFRITIPRPAQPFLPDWVLKLTRGVVRRDSARTKAKHAR